MAENKVNKLFWWGFNQRVQDKFMRRLLTKFPNYNLSSAWPMKDVYTVAKEYFNPLTFDRDSPL